MSDMLFFGWNLFILYCFGDTFSLQIMIIFFKYKNITLDLLKKEYKNTGAYFTELL